MTSSRPSGVAMRMGPWSETEHLDEYLRLIDQSQSARAAQAVPPAAFPQPAQAGPRAC